ncbi:MAG: hypothetical protein GEV28_02205 [Actinophytocola sp.]|uniref:hypothetical protein n=1 Tax=Actinophytocola sp. TaxID=1872138 RepID=UPI0013236287|nr:hypothetical protein [Actinophytocola sp.]MPZ79258.1 hypothetical protein [Actinophytocola sp.]
MLLLTPLLPGRAIPWRAWLGARCPGWGTGVGMAFLYRGLSRGAMRVVVAVTAVGGPTMPVRVGIVVLDDRPTLLAMVGMGLAVRRCGSCPTAGARRPAPRTAC